MKQPVNTYIDYCMCMMTVAVGLFTVITKAFVFFKCLYFNTLAICKSAAQSTAFFYSTQGMF